MSVKSHSATQLALQGELSEYSGNLRLAGNFARQTVGKCCTRRWVACWLCLVGIVCLCCEWSHEPFANYAGTSRKRVSKSVSQGAPFWQASKANYVSGWTEKIEFFCPTKNAYLQSRVCDSIMQHIVQDEQRGARQRAFAAYDAAECRTKVRRVGTEKFFVLKFLSNNLF